MSDPFTPGDAIRDNEVGHIDRDTMAWVRHDALTIELLKKRLAGLITAARQDAERIASRDRNIESLQKRVTEIGEVARAQQTAAARNLARIGVLQTELETKSRTLAGITKASIDRNKRLETRMGELETWTSELDKLAKFYAQERDAALARVRELESKLSLANDRHLTLERETQWTSGEIHLGGEIISVRFRGELHLSPIHQEVKVHA